MTELETLTASITSLVELFSAMNQPTMSEMEIQRRDLQTQVDIYELQARLAILNK